MSYIKVILTIIAILLALNIVKSMIPSATATGVQDEEDAHQTRAIVGGRTASLRTRRSPGQQGFDFIPERIGHPFASHRSSSYIRAYGSFIGINLHPNSGVLKQVLRAHPSPSIGGRAPFVRMKNDPFPRVNEGRSLP